MFDQDGEMYAMTEHSDLIHVTNISPLEKSKSKKKRKKKDYDLEDESGNIFVSDTQIIAKLGMGNPLGGKFDYNKEKKTLYFADSVMGLCRIHISDDNPKVELVATHNQKDGSPLTFVDDVDIGRKTGHIYFSSATEIPTIRLEGTKWAPMYVSQLDFSRGKKTGKLLRYNPDTDEVDVLIDNLWFANGVAVDVDENYVIVSETFGARAWKYHLTGAKKGTSEIFVDKLTGFVDGADCSHSTRMCYVALPGAKPAILSLIYSIPFPFAEAMVRTFLLLLPPWIFPKPTKYGAIVEIDPSIENLEHRKVRTIQDPEGKDIHMITGVTEHKGKLYLGSIANNFIGVYDL